jgi:hypothetical protein
MKEKISPEDQNRQNCIGTTVRKLGKTLSTHPVYKDIAAP